MAHLDTVPGGLVIDAGDMSASITSKAVDIRNTTSVGIQAYAASATHVGTLAVQVSNDGTNWNAVAWVNSAGSIVTSVAAASGSAFSEHIDLSGLGATYLRLVYTFSSGIGTLNAWVQRKAA